MLQCAGIDRTWFVYFGRIVLALLNSFVTKATRQYNYFGKRRRLQEENKHNHEVVENSTTSGSHHDKNNDDDTKKITASSSIYQVLYFDQFPLCSPIHTDGYSAEKDQSPRQAQLQQKYVDHQQQKEKSRHYQQHYDDPFLIVSYRNRSIMPYIILLIDTHNHTCISQKEYMFILL